jgi:hypothetical protein
MLAGMAWVVKRWAGWVRCRLLGHVLLEDLETKDDDCLILEVLAVS